MPAEDVAEMADHLPRFFPVAGVERRLAAAGLLGRERRSGRPAAGEVDRRPADLRIELVDIAGNEQGRRLALLIGRVVLSRGDGTGGEFGLFRGNELDHRAVGGEKEGLPLFFTQPSF